MRVLLAVLSCLMFAVLIAVVAVCGVVSLESPVDAGLAFAEAPESAKCSLLSATAASAEHLDNDLACARCSFNLERQVNVLVTTYNNRGANSVPTAYFSNPGVRGPGVCPGA